MAQQQPIPIQSLSIEQLSGLKETLEEELAHLQSSIQTLKIALTRYSESKNSLEPIKPENQGRKLLVPLTGSLYVAGEIGHTDTVTVDIGTGYYVKMSVPDAKGFFDRKVAMVKENIDKVQAQMGTQRKNLESIMFVMQQKLMQQQAGNR